MATKQAAALLAKDDLESLQDTTIQSLYGVSLQLENCLQLLDDAPEQVRPQLNAAIKSLNSLIRDVRRSIFGLPPIEAGNRSLASGLRILIEDLRVNSLINADLRPSPSLAEISAQLTESQTRELLEIAKECLANVREHSLAGRVSLEVGVTDDRLVLVVSDDGVGANVTAFHSSRGISDMRHRTIELGGVLEIASERGLGTTVTVSVPFRRMDG
ncbi:MAG TPA: histidine kinase [Dehalococcoidia bacterium]|nr:histidine kinase [Dehalococcoidia bacterium]